MRIDTLPLNKLAFIIVESNVEPDVMAALEEMGLKHYTRFADLHGHGETGRREGTAIFPGLNVMIMVAMPGEMVAGMVHKLHEVRDAFMITPGMKIIVTDAEMF